MLPSSCPGCKHLKCFLSIRYRFRLLNIACEPNYNFTIDGHNFTIIEADGEYTQPLEVDFIQIFAAQRYSIIVSCPSLCWPSRSQYHGRSLMRLNLWTTTGFARTQASRSLMDKALREASTQPFYVMLVLRTLIPRLTKPQA